MFKKMVMTYNINANENLQVLGQVLTFSIKYSILLLHLKKCNDMKMFSRLWMVRVINDSNREMLVAYGWCEL